MKNIIFFQKMTEIWYNYIFFKNLEKIINNKEYFYEEFDFSKNEDLFFKNFIKKKVMREINIIRQLNHENIIKIRDIFFPDFNSFEKFILVYDFESNYQFISKKSLKNNEVKYIFYQILLSIFYLHSNDIIHRDINPQSFLINEKNQIKLINFKLSSSNLH
jgi:serine/threonine protein kinase